jgi:hypothetical protein
MEKIIKLSLAIMIIFINNFKTPIHGLIIMSLTKRTRWTVFWQFRAAEEMFLVAWYVVQDGQMAQFLALCERGALRSWITY